MEHKPVIVINIRESEEQLVHICGYEGKIICKCSCEEHVPLVSLEIEMKNEIFLIQIYNWAILSGHLWSVKFLFFWYLAVSWIICASVKQNFFYRSEKKLVNNISCDIALKVYHNQCLPWSFPCSFQRNELAWCTIPNKKLTSH